MNKILIVTFFAFLTLGQCFQPAQDGIVAFFKAAQNIDVPLNDKCFGTETDKTLEKLKKYADSENVTLILLTAQKLATDLYTNCPKDEAIALGTLIYKKIEDQSILEDIMKKATEATKIALKEYKATEHTGESIGRTAGQIVDVFIRENAKFLNFLQSNSLAIDALSIFEGFINGLAKDASCTKCHDSVMKNKDVFVEIVTEIINAIKTGENIIEVITKAITKIIGMSGMITDCRLLSLVKAVQEVITKEGVQKLIARVTAHVPELIKIGTDFIRAITTKDDIGIGYAIGAVTKILLDFYVN